MADPHEIAKWRRAHPIISVPDEGLATMAPFPSLYASDFAVYLEARGLPAEMVRFVVDLNRETIWVYDNWAKAQRDGDPKRMIEDMLNNVGAVSGGGGDYSLTKKFLTDYAKANGIVLSSDVDKAPKWMDAMRAPGATEGAGTLAVSDETIVPQSRPSVAVGGITDVPAPLPSPGPDEEVANAVPDR